MAKLPDGLIFEYELDHKGINITCTERELVMCRNCKHFLPYEPCIGGTYQGCEEIEGRDGCPLEVYETFWCAFGEKSENLK